MNGSSAGTQLIDVEVGVGDDSVALLASSNLKSLTSTDVKLSGIGAGRFLRVRWRAKRNYTLLVKYFICIVIAS